jgi:hypothetical protein
MKKLGKNLRMRDQFHMSAPILAWKRRPVALVITLNLLRQAMRSVPYRRTARASKTADNYGTFSFLFFCMQPCHPSGAIRSEYSTNDVVQWLRMTPWTPSIGWYWRCCCSCISWAVETGRIRVLLSVANNFVINLTMYLINSVKLNTK